MDKECIGCGLCEAMCHKKAIRIIEDKDGSFCDRNTELCDNCGVCSKLCPVEQLKEKEELSQVDTVAIGRSKDEHVVTNSASGGIVSETLMHLFRTGQIDAAIVAFFDHHANIYGDVIENEGDVLKHSGSYYHTSNQLINVKKIKQYNKLAVVGLPCHIDGIKNYCKLTGQMDKVITISLFCTIGRTYEGFRRFIKHETGFDVAKGEVRDYQSRIGDRKLIHIEDDKGNVYECPDEKYKFTMDFFSANRTCLECRKMYGLSADISVGDAWHKVNEENGVKQKRAIISANTKYGEVLLGTLRESLQLEYVTNGAYELASSQRYGTGLKQFHNESIVRRLDKIRCLRKLNDNPLLFRVSCRLRGKLLDKLGADTEKVKDQLR
ncbi:MAG: Coenzyme F420 hydrogenase/dehydrogenase, beta subunit C-terminal domain [Lachnospiraceae bacterium]|nr:Coenzyme F420 hydrogenase/dehydrogenase, beta subunit C-terminal domain [Lachnospiraceae bacterium]